MRDFVSWMTLRDYEEAKQDAVYRIVRRQSRGNVNIQHPDGWYMTMDELIAKSKVADLALRRLRHSAP